MVQDPCPSQTITIDAANVLKNASPVATYVVDAVATVISWPRSEVVSSAPAVCGSVVYELWDESSGSDVAVSVAGIFTESFSTATHSITI